MTTLAQSVFDGVALGAMLSLPALGIAMIWRIAGFPHVAHGSLMTVAPYTAWVVVTLFKWPLAIAVALGLAAAAAVGVAMYLGVYRPLQRRPMFSIFLASVGLSLLFRFGIAAVFGTDFKNFPVAPQRGLTVSGVTMNPLDLLLIGVAIIALGGTWFMLRMTLIGKRMRAVADNVTLARLHGVRPETTLLYMWVMVSVLAGIAGILLAIRNTLYPDIGWDLLLPTFAAAIVGGIINPFGAAVGAFMIGVAADVGVIWIPTSYEPAIAFVAIALVLALRPTGLFGESSRA